MQYSILILLIIEEQNQIPVGNQIIFLLTVYSYYE